MLEVVQNWLLTVGRDRPAAWVRHTLRGSTKARGVPGVSRQERNILAIHECRLIVISSVVVVYV